MKTLMLLLLLASCGGSGGGGSSSSGGNAGPSYDDFLAKTIYNFHLIVEGCNGSTFTVVAFTDEGWPEENRNDWNGGIGPGGTTNIVVTGRELNWELTSVGGGCALTMKLYRQFGAGVPALIETKVVANNGDIETISY